MAFYTNRSWTICGFIGAFIDLALAYCLLCVSAFVFLPFKFLNLFGVCVPCPCTGVFGYTNNYLCWHKVLIDLPIRKILYVQMMIKSKFPFDMIWFHHQSCRCDHGVLELENEGCSSSFWGPKLQNLVDRESEFDAKGKKIANQKQKYGTRRRRRSSFSYWKSSSMQSVVAGASSSTCNGTDIKSEIGEKEDGFRVSDDGNGANGLDLGVKLWDSFEQGGSYVKSKVEDNDSSSLIKKFICNAEENLGKPGNEQNMIRKLEEALQEEKTACAAVRLELEKERAAAASAADEAMAMILRLQADKAAIEMEARQYQRMIEEQFAYEEEEMEIMKDILIRRERENHFLEKEVEAYRQMKCLGNRHSEIDFSYMTSELGQKALCSSDPKEGPSRALQDIEKSRSIGKNANWPPTYESSSAEVTSESFQTCSGIEEILSCCGEKLERDGNYKTEVCVNQHDSILDSESITYDVHVIDDKIELQREGNGKATVTDFGVSSGELVSDGSSASITQSNQISHRNYSDMNNGVPEFGNSRSKKLVLDSACSSPAANGESLKIDTEVELLRERLRILQKGKDKLSFSAEQRESINALLRLVEDLLNQLREIQQIRDPLGQASLSPPSSKASLKKIRSQSKSLESQESS